MKNTILHVNRFFAENQDGKIIILDKSGIANSTIGDSARPMDSLRDIGFSRDYRMMWESLKSFISRSEKVFLPTGVDQHIEISKKTSPRELLRIVSERIVPTAYDTSDGSSSKSASYYCSKMLREILRSSAVDDEAFYGDIVRWAVGLEEDLALINMEAMSIVSKCSDSEVRRLNLRAERIAQGEIFEYLRGMNSEDGEAVGTYAEIRDAVVLNRRLTTISRNKELVREWISVDQSPQKELRDVYLMRHWRDSEKDEAMRACMQETMNTYYSHTLVNAKHAIGASDEDIAEIITAISGPGQEEMALSKTPLMLLEVYRRGMQDDYYMSAESLVNCLSDMYGAFPVWPSFYSKEIDAIARDIARRATDSTMEGVFRMVQKYLSGRFSGSGSKVEVAFNRFMKPNIRLLNGVSTLAGKSQDYAELLVLNKAMLSPGNSSSRDGVDSTYYDDRDVKLVRSSTLDSIYLRAFIVSKTMSDEGDEMPEGLLREIYSDAFRMLLSANKAERKNFIRLISYSLHNPSAANSCKAPLDLRARVLMEELSSSKLKDATIEKILSVPEPRSGSWRRESSNRKILGMSYVEMASLASKSVRESLKATLLRMELE
jgi:hypothetical protein